jgi:hypothetical protein
VGAVALAATLAAVVTGVAPAYAAPEPEGESSVIGTTVSFGATLSFGAMLPTPQQVNVCPPEPEECDPGGGSFCPPFCQLPPPVGCDVLLLQQSGTFSPEGGYSHIVWGSSVTCTGGAHVDHALTYLTDRSPGNIGLIPPIGGLVQGPTTYAQSSGHMDLYPADILPAATRVEQVLSVNLHLNSGVWAPCNNRPTNRVLWCNGVGTSNLSAGIGFFDFDTHLTG